MRSYHSQINTGVRAVKIRAEEIKIMDIFDFMNLLENYCEGRKCHDCKIEKFCVSTFILNTHAELENVIEEIRSARQSAITSR
jgi:hypothetical protein